MAAILRRRASVNILRGVPYETYAQLRDVPANAHLRMTYHDGILEIMSPELSHERPSRRIGMIVNAVTCELGIPCSGSRSTTFRRGGRLIGADPARARFAGVGKEPDESFYIAHAEFLGDKASIDLDVGDPPPDLWIEVDHRSSSKGRLPVYAVLGVPEVWRYRARSKRLWFGRLSDGGVYEEIGRSLALPMLTPALILEALAMCEGSVESIWDRQLRAWVREKFGPPVAENA